MKKNFEFLKKNLFFIVVLIVTIVFFIVNNIYTDNGSNFTNGIDLTTYTANNVPIINSSFDNTFFSTSLVDTKLIDYAGNEKWAYSTMYSSPKTSFSKNYLAVWGDKSSGNIDIFNKKGFVYQINNSQKILDVDINKNGYVAILVKDITDSGYVLKVYNNIGENLVERVCDTENTFPISVSLSEDNRVVSLSEIDTNSLTASSYVTFSYVNKNENKNAEDIFAGVTFKDEIIAKIDFSKNYLVAYTKDKIHIILITNDVAKEVATIPLDNEIKFASIISEKYIVLALGNPMNYNASDSNVIVFYDFNGNEKTRVSVETIVKEMTPAENSVIITSDRKVIKVNDTGKIEYNYLHNKNFSNAYYIGKKTPVVIAESDKIVSIIKSKNN